MGNVAGLYESIITDPRLRGHEPDSFVVDKAGEIYISAKDTATIINLSAGRLRALVSENRLDAFKPGGHDSFISLNSIDKFLIDGRKTPGRPPKDKP